MKMNKKIILVLALMILLFVNISAKDFIVRNNTNHDTYFKVDGETGNVGIGSSNPKTNLQINGEMGFNDNVYYKSDADMDKFPTSFASKEYVDKKVLSNVASANLTYISNDSKDDSYAVWGDGNYIYSSGYLSSVKVFKPNLDGTLTSIFNISSIGTATPNGLCGDKKFLYQMDTGDGIHVFSINGDGTLTLKDSDDQGGYYYHCFSDGNFLYVSGSDGLHTYSVNHSTGGLTHIDSSGVGGYYLWSDGNFIYTSDTTGVSTYSVNSTGMINLLSFTSSSGFGGFYSIFGDENFIYVASFNYPIVYTFTSNLTGGLTLVANSTTYCPSHRGYLESEGFLYMACLSEGLKVFIVNGTGGLRQVGQNNQSSDTIGGGFTVSMDLWSDGNFIYDAYYTGLFVFKSINGYEYDFVNQSHYFNDKVSIGYDSGLTTAKIQLDADTFGTNTGWQDSSNREIKELFSKLKDVVLPKVKLGKWETKDNNVIDAVEYDEGNVSLTNDELLKRLNLLPINHWSFIDDDEEKLTGKQIYHIGPTAQDFYKMFGLGAKDTSIKATDVAGVALAGVKAQIDELEDLEKRNKNLEDEIDRLTKKLEVLKNE